MRRLSLVLAVFALLASGAASAATLSSRFPAFQAELQARLALIPATHLSKLEKKQKTAVNKALSALAVDTTDPTKAAANVKKAVAPTDGAFPADVTFDPILTTVVEAIEGDAVVRNGGLVNSIQSLADGSKARKRSQAKYDSASATLAKSKTAPTRAARLKLIVAANTAMAAGEAIVKKAGGTPGGGVTSTALDVDINSPATHLHYPAPTPPFGNFQVLYNSAADTFTLSAQGTVNATMHTFAVFLSGPGEGSRSVTLSPMSSYAAPGVTPPPAVATGGTVNFTTWDPANAKVGGTIDVTYSNGTSTVHVTGTFSSISLAVQ